MNDFSISCAPLEGLRLIERRKLADSRGFLSRIYASEELKSCGWTKEVAHINHTYTAKRGTLRGMHFQVMPHAEMKLVTCIRGAIIDVVVDIRQGSKTFLSHHMETLSEQNNRSLLIPEGFAHGFQALTDNVELIYCHSEPYSPSCESGLHPLDSSLGISWPIPVEKISSKDASYALIDKKYKGLFL